jgi:hypothetical protein
MDEPVFQLGHSDFNNQTVLNPLGLIAILVLGTALLLVPRRYAVWPMIIMSSFVAPAQRIAIFTLNFDLLRIMVIFGTLRIVFRNEWKGFIWRKMDGVLVVFAVVGTSIYLLQYGTLDAVKYKLGFMYDMLGMYFLFRCLVRDADDLARIALGFAMISVPVALAFVVERATGRNMFAVFGGVPVVTVVREGRLRCQGAYADPILAGCYWASVLPLMAALWWRTTAQRWWAVTGVVCGLIIIVLCASSTPVSAVAMGLVGACFFAVRRRMRLVRWLILGALVSLHLVMNAPVWHLISRFDLAGGSTGYFRYVLINEFIVRVNEWWLLGVKDVTHWGIPNGDIVNYYVAQGVNGGLWALVLFVLLIVMGFSGVGRLWRQAAGNRADLILSWALGVSLFIHCVSFLGVSYFGQIQMLWYLTLAMIASLTPPTLYAAMRLCGQGRSCAGFTAIRAFLPPRLS